MERDKLHHFLHRSHHEKKANKNDKIIIRKIYAIKLDIKKIFFHLY